MFSNTAEKCPLFGLKPDIENRIKEGSVKAYFNSNLLRIMEKQIVVQTPASQITLDNDFVFAMTGYHPDFELLQQIGISLGNDNYLTPRFEADTLQTNRPGIYLAGVVCGGMETSRFFIENSREHARAIFDHMEKNYDFRKDS